MNSTTHKPHNGKLLHRQARAAVIARGETIKSFCRSLSISRNTFTLALRSDTCPHARAKILKALKLAA